MPYALFGAFMALSVLYVFALFADAMALCVLLWPVLAACALGYVRAARAVIRAERALEGGLR